MKPAAKQGDHVVATDTHLCSGAPAPVPFDGVLDEDLSPNVLAEHRYVAVVGSRATNTPPHVPPPGTTFDISPHNTGRVVAGSGTVLVNHKPFARDGDAAETCNDPADAPVGVVVAASTVVVGG
jgi:uncharacterized Zn-binding protein involved in type VI secretion